MEAAKMKQHLTTRGTYAAKAGYFALLLLRWAHASQAAEVRKDGQQLRQPDPYEFLQIPIKVLEGAIVDLLAFASI